MKAWRPPISQKAEIMALTRQVETLKRQLVRVNDEAGAEREQRDAATIELSSSSPQKLNKLVQQKADERVLGRRVLHCLKCC